MRTRKLWVFALSVFLIACGSGGGGNNKSQNLASSEQTSSSMASDIPVTYLYPVQNSNFSSVDETFFVIETKSSIDIESIFVDGVAFTELSTGIWRSEEAIALDDGEIMLSPVINTVQGDFLTGTSITFFNNPTSTAGRGEVVTSQALVFSDVDNTLYASAPMNGAIMALPLATGVKENILQLPPAGLGVQWPLAYDNAKSNLILLSENESGAVEITTISKEGIGVCEEANDPITSPADVYIDSAGSFPYSFEVPTLYTLDSIAVNPIQIRFLDNGGQDIVSYSATEIASYRQDNERLAMEFNIDVDNEVFQVLLLRGTDPGLLSLNTKLSRTGPSASIELISDFTGYDISSPSSMVFDASNQLVYIADRNKIWSVSINTGAIELISSSTTLNPLGQGPSIDARTADMAIHSEAQILYMTTQNSGSIMAIDIATGDRVTVSD